MFSSLIKIAHDEDAALRLQFGAPRSIQPSSNTSSNHIRFHNDLRILLQELSFTAPHSLSTLRTVPFSLWCLGQANTAVMKPFDWAFIVIASDHFAVRYLVAKTITRFVRITIPLRCSYLFSRCISTSALASVLTATAWRYAFFFSLFMPWNRLLALLHPGRSLWSLFFSPRRPLDNSSQNRAQARVTNMFSTCVQRLYAQMVDFTKSLHQIRCSGIVERSFSTSWTSKISILWSSCRFLFKQWAWWCVWRFSNTTTYWKIIKCYIFFISTTFISEPSMILAKKLSISLALICKLSLVN